MYMLPKRVLTDQRGGIAYDVLNGATEGFIIVVNCNMPVPLLSADLSSLSCKFVASFAAPVHRTVDSPLPVGRWKSNARLKWRPVGSFELTRVASGWILMRFALE